MITTVQKYIKVYQRIKKLEEEKEKLSYKILDEMDDNHQKAIETEFGTLSQVPRTTYEYSDAVTTAANRVSEMKKAEERAGTATIKSITRYVKFNKPDTESISAPRIR